MGGTSRVETYGGVVAWVRHMKMSPIQVWRMNLAVATLHDTAFNKKVVFFVELLRNVQSSLPICFVDTFQLFQEGSHCQKRNLLAGSSLLSTNSYTSSLQCWMSSRVPAC